MNKIVVDTNIVFSAMLNTNSLISNIILQPKSKLKFYSTSKLLEEIDRHSDKLKSLSGYTDSEMKKISSLFINRIRFVNIRLIPKNIYVKTLLLTKEVDIDDTEFVALTDFIGGKLWSGDKKLKRGLIKKGWNKFIATEDLRDS